MATGRTLNRWSRVYVSGYDMSCYSKSIGELVAEYGAADLTAEMCDAVRGYLPDTPNITPGTLNGVFDNTATVGLHALYSAPGASRIVTVALGIRAAPAQGDPVFHGKFYQLGYQAVENGGAMNVTVPFGGWDATGLINYTQPWGWLLHANSAATAANTSTGIDDFGAATSLGGYMVYHVLAGNGTATISVEDAATNSNAQFSALSGATTGSIDCSSPKSGIVALGIGATVRRYLRWQISFGTANTVTFVLSFTRIVS